jgi:hypothetical protein
VAGLRESYKAGRSPAAKGFYEGTSVGKEDLR